MEARELLRKHLADAGLDQSRFAAQLGVSKGSVSLWLSGKIRPDGASALLIQSATGGAVPFPAWYADPPTQRRKSKRGPRAASPQAAKGRTRKARVAA